MKTKLISSLLAIMFVGLTVKAEWVTDYEFNFKIDVPASWTKNMFNDGTDRVHAFLSPDENLAIRIRAFKVDQNVTLDLVASLFKNNILGQCEQLTLRDKTINGYRGMLGAYRGYYNGTRVGAGVFYTIQNGIAYIVWSVAPIHLFDTKVTESDGITSTFTILSSNVHSYNKSHSSGLSNTFRDRGLGYSIQYPSNWVFTKTKPYIVIFSGRQGTPEYYVTVNIQNLASTSMGGNFNNVDGVIQHFKNQLYSGARNVYVSQAERFDFQVAGRNISGKVLEMSYTRQNENFKQMLVVFPRYDYKLFYAFMYTAAANDYNRYQNIAIQMLDTWNIE